MRNKGKNRLVPYDMVSLGFEAVYTGEKITKSNEISEKKIQFTTQTNREMLLKNGQHGPGQN